jgi:ParB-like chromosome segregation protein Spo0J
VQNPADDSILVRQIVENWQRADLHPFETADTLARLRDELRLSQREIARKTGKPESEISKFLALLKLSPDVQHDARADASGDIGRRHLVALAQLPAAEQRPMLEQVRARRLSAEETEKAVQEKNAERSVANRGAPRAHRTRFLVGPALVEVTFRRKEVSQEDICGALERALAKARTAGE